LTRLNAAPPPPSVETSLQVKEMPLANTGRYDSLRKDLEETTSVVEEVSHD
jgi:hypothetical protein